VILLVIFETKLEEKKLISSSKEYARNRNMLLKAVGQDVKSYWQDV